ncbi:selenide, water dikinase [Spirochaetia bacterium]|nr:selenide, water dikinase [Spirochaetia bacterium]
MDLLSNCTSGGCGAKIGPGDLGDMLSKLRCKNDPRLLVGFGGRDDGAVYQIDERKALVSTVDFFSPMVNDPYLFGKIAAANALSDIYAMGGKPLFALNLICFPEKMDKKILEEILAGGAEKTMEADTVIAGGHSIYDHEPKYGMAVTGLVDPHNVLRNDSCKAQDVLILTKALGVGLVMAAERGGEASRGQVKAAADSMERLNRYAAEKFIYSERYQRAVHACTDVTGFGLAVHASEMAGKDHSIVIDSSSLPILEGALDFAEKYFATAAGQRNRNYIAESIDISCVTQAMEEIVFDPQTSGGLLIAVEAEFAQRLCDEIKEDDPSAAIIGEVIKREDKAVIIL